ncbi:hypothetical protein K1T71_006478 [Dendrolimus kikuchii]|uniref:Uncharacterized protein n=1 Tax=Dendrolimus kikuchii TaxID=765133 RepID=A0ACC1D1I7_9NEOP|nr:hypothetical protein K1T71_006478 [Dendrolimus kikuchii]
MGLKKKKNIIILTLCVVISFILYQLYFFLTITSETASSSRVIPVLDRAKVKELMHLRSEDDKFINNIGVIRGVFYAHMPKYRPDDNNEFKCLKTGEKIAFELLNDDYCDCDDGTDEPSTNACVNGTFYCDTQYHSKPILLHQIQSSKVNDGICDCCDGSDEFTHEPNKKLLSQSNDRHYRYYVTKCPNNC